MVCVTNKSFGKILCLQETILKTNNSHTVIWFQVFLHTTNTLQINDLYSHMVSSIYIHYKYFADK